MVVAVVVVVVVVEEVEIVEVVEVKVAAAGLIIIGGEEVAV